MFYDEGNPQQPTQPTQRKQARGIGSISGGGADFRRQCDGLQH